MNPRFTPDGSAIEFLVGDDRSDYPARLGLKDSSVERLMASPIVVSNATRAGGCSAVLSGSESKFTEVYALEGGSLRQLSHRNDALQSELIMPKTEEVSFKSKDGTDVHGLLTTPVGYIQGSKVPLLLRIHGGPNGQDDHRWSLERQWFAANGYAVLAVNYRGSSGRGRSTRVPSMPIGATTKWKTCWPGSTMSSGWASPIRPGWASAAGAMAAF